MQLNYNVFTTRLKSLRGSFPGFSLPYNQSTTGSGKGSDTGAQNCDLEVMKGDSMSSFLKNVMSKFRNYDEENYEYDMQDTGDAQDESNMNFEALSLQENAPDRAEATRSVSERQNMRVMDFRSGCGHQVILIKPNHIDAAQAVSRHIQAGRTVVCNFENCEAFPPQRILDFINGAAFALGGSVRPISSNIFVVAPANVSLMDSSQVEARTATPAYGRRAVSI